VRGPLVTGRASLKSVSPPKVISVVTRNPYIRPCVFSEYLGDLPDMFPRYLRDIPVV
jgi:hypothetical protein